MATNVHLLMTLQGGYTDPTLAGETWQTGVRWYATNATPAAIGTLPTDIGPVSDTINRTETNWTISGNWYMSGPASSVLHVDDWLNDQVAPAAASLIATTRFPSTVELRAIRVYPIGNDGKAIPAPPYAAGSPVTLQWKAANTPNGTGSSGPLPLQIACVASLRTQQIGPKGRGRMFLPALATGQLAGNGVWATGVPDGIALSVADFLTDASLMPSVADFVVEPIVTGGTYTDYAVVNSVRVGSIPDTQRRRRRSLVEVYTSRPFPSP